MDQSRSINRSTNQKKTSYFEKYRRELERISDQMKKDTYSLSNASLASPIVKDKNQLITFKQLNHEPKSSTLISTSPVQSKNVMTKPNIFIKKDYEITNSLIIEPKEDLQYTAKQAQVLKQVEGLIQQFQGLKKKLQKVELQIEGKKKIMNGIKKNLSGGVTEKQYMDNIVTYASKILNIEQKMKDKKEAHEEQLGKLVAQKDQIHAQNVQISKQIELCEEQAEKIEKQSQALQAQSPLKNLEAKANKLRLQISKLQQKYEQMVEGVNRNQEIKEMATREYKKYVQIYTKKLIGRQVALAEDRIKARNENQRYEAEIEKKKLKLNDKKIELMIRKRSLNDANRVIANLHTKIKNLQNEIKAASPVDRKLSIFEKL